jgi:uncharacterized repeat protein (TIGR03803 family)
MQRNNWKTKAHGLWAAVVLIIGFLLTQPTDAQTYTVLHHFTGASDGANPLAGVTVDSGGSLYGTTMAGGRKGFGTVYRLANSGGNWVFYLVYSFAGFEKGDGSGPYARVVIGPDGALYGTTRSGGGGQGCRELHGCGTVYRVRAKPGDIQVPWTEDVLYSFGTYDGSDPYYGDLVFDHMGNLYGATMNGGAYLQGAVYELSPAGGTWTEQVVYSFAGPDGAAPVNGPVIDQSGHLYGTTSSGGSGGFGAIYQLSRSGSIWTESVLHSFQSLSDGLTPSTGAFLDPSGNLFGATQAGGVGGGGTVFELTPLGNGNWNLRTLYGFSGSSLGSSYRTLVMDRAGNLYGTASGDGMKQHGSVFKLTWSNGAWSYTSLHDFTGGTDGGTPFGTLAFDATGNIYGTASTGGAYGNGVLFEITP